VYQENVFLLRKFVWKNNWCLDELDCRRFRMAFVTLATPLLSSDPLAAVRAQCRGT
jgi:hypothetical protein